MLICEPNTEVQPTGLSSLRGGFGLRSSGERQNYVRIPYGIITRMSVVQDNVQL